LGRRVESIPSEKPGLAASSAGLSYGNGSHLWRKLDFGAFAKASSSIYNLAWSLAKAAEIDLRYCFSRSKRERPAEENSN
jgi:hypothetical protein